MDTFFATTKGGRSTCGHTCCQLFVTDKGFLYVMPMRRKSEVLQAIKQFAKEIGAPTSIIADMSGEQMSHDIRKFCNDIGTTLWALEEPHGPIKLNCILDSSRRQSERTCVNQTPRCPYGTTVLKDERGLTTSRQRTTLNYVEQCLILQPWLRRVTYHPFANFDGTNGDTIVNRRLLFPTIMKYLEESWALPKVKAMRWPNGFSRPTGRLCPDNHYNH